MDTPLIIFFLHLGTQVALALVGLTLYRVVTPGYKPMIWFVFGLLAIEIFLSFFNLESEFSKTVYGSHYLLEGLLVCWLGKKMKVFTRPYQLPLAIILIAGCWLIDRFILGDMERAFSWSRAVAHLVITLIGIQMATGTMVDVSGRLWKHPLYVFSVSLVFFYGGSVILEFCGLMISNPSETFLKTLFYGAAALGIITNLLYLKAILCAPKKLAYSTQ